MSRYTPRRITLLLAGCVVLGIGVGLLLTADLGSDGFSTLVNGIARRDRWAFVIANIAVSTVFLAVAALRRVWPDVGTIVQVVVVGSTVSVVLDTLETPAAMPARYGLIALAIPALAVGAAAYLGSRLGAGPVEALALAWQPPGRFSGNYSLIQGVSALLGWFLGAAIGPGTIAVVVLLGPGITLASRVMRLRITQPLHR